MANRLLESGATRLIETGDDRLLEIGSHAPTDPDPTPYLTSHRLVAQSLHTLDGTTTHHLAAASDRAFDATTSHRLDGRRTYRRTS